MKIFVVLLCMAQQWLNVSAFPRSLTFARGGDTSVKLEGSRTSLCYDTECSLKSTMLNENPKEFSPWKNGFAGRPTSEAVDYWSHSWDKTDADGLMFTEVTSYEHGYYIPGDDQLTKITNNVSVSSDNAEIPFSNGRTMHLTPGALWNTMSFSNWRFRNNFNFLEYKFTIALYDANGNGGKYEKTKMSNGATRYTIGGTSYFELYPVTLNGLEMQNYELTVSQSDYNKVNFEVFYYFPYFEGQVNMHCVMGDTALTTLIAPTGYTPTTVLAETGENLATKFESFQSLQVSDTIKAYFKANRGLRVDYCLTAACTSRSTIRPSGLAELEAGGISRTGGLNITHGTESPWTNIITKQDKNGVEYTETVRTYTMLQHGTHEVHIWVYLRAIAEEATIDLGGKEYTFPKHSFVYEYVYDGGLLLKDPENTLIVQFEIRNEHINARSFRSMPPAEQTKRRFTFNGPVYFDLYPAQVGSEFLSSEKNMGQVYLNSLTAGFRASHVSTTTRYVIAVGALPPSNNSPDCPPGQNCDPNVGTTSGSSSNDVLQDDGSEPDEESSNATGTVLIILALLAILVVGGYYSYRKNAQRNAQQQDLKTTDSVSPVPGT